MPGLNGTGPQGAGSMTGRGMGYCNKSNENIPLFGRGRGLNSGRGRGMNCRGGFGYGGYYGTPQMTPEQQKDVLEQQRSFLENQLKSIDKQIEKL